MIASFSGRGNTVVLRPLETLPPVGAQPMLFQKCALRRNTGGGAADRKGKRKGLPAKNLMAEHHRRKKLNDRLYMLRSIVPKISKVGIDEGEEPRAAAVRELREETSVTSTEIMAEAPNWLTYDFPPDVRDKLNARWGMNWKGQAQK